MMSGEMKLFKKKKTKILTFSSDLAHKQLGTLTVVFSINTLLKCSGGIEWKVRIERLLVTLTCAASRLRETHRDGGHERLSLPVRKQA